MLGQILGLLAIMAIIIAIMLATGLLIAGVNNAIQSHKSRVARATRRLNG
jgi:hypothetical protein